MNLSDHFTLAELTFSETAARKNIDNIPDEQAIENLKRLCEVLEQVRNIIGKPIHVTSGYRCPELNSAIGGAKNSDHMTGCAADIVVSGMSPMQVAMAIVKANISFKQLIKEYDRWVHISVPKIGEAPKNEVLTYKHGRAVIAGLV